MTVRKKYRVSRKGKKRIAIFIVILALIIAFFEIRLKPVVCGIAEVQAQALSTEIINRTVTEVLEEMNIGCEDLEEINISSNGTISSINTNTITVNKLKNAVSLKVQENLSDVKNKRVNVPLGTILGSNLFNGQGPDIPLYITLSGNVKSDFESVFESGGVNQTVHKLCVKISADITIVMPMSTVSTSVETSVLVGETVIVGSVPSGMLYGKTY